VGLDLNADNNFRRVINIESRNEVIYGAFLERRYEYPWDLRICPDWLSQRFRIIRGEEAEQEAQAGDFAPIPYDQNVTHPPDIPEGVQDQQDSPRPRSRPESPAQPARGDLQVILDADDETLTDILARPTVRAHKRYQRAIAILQTRRDEIMGDLGREIDDVIDRDHTRAAYRGLHDQIGGLLARTFKEIDFNEIVLIIIEVLRRFKPEESPLDASDPDSPISPGFSGGQTANIRGNNNTTIFFNSYGGSDKAYQTSTATGKRPRRDCRGRRRGWGDDDDGDDDDESGQGWKKAENLK
jgi:hypothetical protein